MKIPSQYQRPLLKLMVQARRRGRNVDLFAPNFSSLAVLAALAGAVWMAFSFARVNVTTATSAAQAPGVLAAPSEGAPQAQSSIRAAVLSRHEGIVYLAEGDNAFYHCSGHLSQEGQRQAMTVDVARSRGFVPCPICFKPKTDNSKNSK